LEWAESGKAIHNHKPYYRAELKIISGKLGSFPLEKLAYTLMALS